METEMDVIQVRLRGLINIAELSTGLLVRDKIQGVKEELFMVQKTAQLMDTIFKEYNGPIEDGMMPVKINFNRAALVLHFIKVVTRISLDHVTYFNDVSKISACLGFDLLLSVTQSIREWLEQNPESSEKILTAANFVYGYAKKTGEIFHEAIDQKEMMVN